MRGPQQLASCRLGAKCVARVVTGVTRSRRGPCSLPTQGRSAGGCALTRPLPGDRFRLRARAGR